MSFHAMPQLFNDIVMTVIIATVVFKMLLIFGSFTTVYSNIGSYRRPPPLSRLGTGTGWHCTVVQCVVMQ